MGWTTNGEAKQIDPTKEDNIKVIAKETVEDRDPELYRTWAKILAKQGEYDKADEEYNKSIKYTGDMVLAYIMKSFFWMGQGRNIRSIIALLVFAWKFFCRNIDFILLFIFISMYGPDTYPETSTFIFCLFVVVERTVRATRRTGDEDGKKIRMKKCKKNVIIAVIYVVVLWVVTFGGLGLIYYIVATLILYALFVIIFATFAINVLAMFFRGIKNII